MKSTIILKILIINVFSAIYIELDAQKGLSMYTEAGKSNVSQGLFIKSAAIGSYQFGKNILEAGFQTDLRCYDRQDLSGITLKASRIFYIKNIPVELTGFSIWTYPSALIVDKNKGVKIQMTSTHFNIAIGTNFRTFSLRERADKEFVSANRNNKIREVNNIMYSFTYFFKPAESKWNVGMTLTNFDHFLINQETNPVFRLHGSYRLNAPVSLIAEAWYKCAGITNLEINHFGFLIRTGIKWNFN